MKGKLAIASLKYEVKGFDEWWNYFEFGTG